MRSKRSGTVAHPFVSQPAVADIDGDGVNELVACRAGGKVVALRAPREPQTTAASVVGSGWQRIGDIYTVAISDSVDHRCRRQRRKRNLGRGRRNATAGLPREDAVAQCDFGFSRDVRRFQWRRASGCLRSRLGAAKRFYRNDDPEFCARRSQWKRAVAQRWLRQGRMASPIGTITSIADDRRRQRRRPR